MLKEVPSLSYGTASANQIIQGDNLQVLEQLQHLKGTVKCIYIDPPYNNGENFAHYDDDVSHFTWEGKIRSRIAALFPFLHEEGSLWVSIDDKEMHHLKVLMDDVLGRDRYVTTVSWQHRLSRENRKAFSSNHEYILVYAKDPKKFRASRNPLSGDSLRERYKNPDSDPRGAWQSVSANAQAGHATSAQFYELVAPNGKRHLPPDGRCWVYTKDRMEKEVKMGNIFFGRDGNGVPRVKKFLSDAKLTLTPETLWLADEVGTTDDAKKQLLGLFGRSDIFDTPKPESLISRIIHIASNPGDIVLDAYLGSGTTAAVAHKMGRQYVGIEMGPHAETHCATRLRLVVDGDQTGCSIENGFNGGGGFSFWRDEP